MLFAALLFPLDLRSQWTCSQCSVCLKGAPTCHLTALLACSIGCSLPELYKVNSACLADICAHVWPAVHVASMLQSLTRHAWVHFSNCVERPDSHAYTIVDMLQHLCRCLSDLCHLIATCSVSILIRTSVRVICVLLLRCSTSKRKLGCNAQLIVDEFGEKLLEELDYLQEARNIQVILSYCTFHVLWICA